MSELKCPFCQQELERDGDQIQCPDINCRHKHDWYGSYDLWQELIRTRKALDVAVDALKLFDSGQYTPQPDSYGLKTDASRLARKALEQITALEQKESAFVHNKIEFPEYNDNLLEEFDKQFFENGQNDDLTETALEQKD